MAKNDISSIASVEPLSRLLADTYTLMLKTQNYHWNVEGPLFFPLHTLLEQQYTELFTAVDRIAERIRALGSYAPGGLIVFRELSEIQDGAGSSTAGQMVEDLIDGHQHIVDIATEVGEVADEAEDPATESMADERIEMHQKAIWMLKSILRHSVTEVPAAAEHPSEDLEGATEKKKKKSKN